MTDRRLGSGAQSEGDREIERKNWTQSRQTDGSLKNVILLIK